MLLHGDGRDTDNLYARSISVFSIRKGTREEMDRERVNTYGSPLLRPLQKNPIESHFVIFAALLGNKKRLQNSSHPLPLHAKWFGIFETSAKIKIRHTLSLVRINRGKKSIPGLYFLAMGHAMIYTYQIQLFASFGRFPFAALMMSALGKVKNSLAFQIFPSTKVSSACENTLIKKSIVCGLSKLLSTAEIYGTFEKAK